eukprot:m.184103 g.184103  ORF g.184103 m.184103 type:complete len:89 (-) comp14709_c0_seq6:163-429(-)
MVFEYIVISVENNMSQGPTFCGDASSDKELMAHCEATLHKDLGDPFQEYLSQLPPRIILNKLAEKGFRVINSAGTGQTLTWTLERHVV